LGDAVYAGAPHPRLPQEAGIGHRRPQVREGGSEVCGDPKFILAGSGDQRKLAEGSARFAGIEGLEARPGTRCKL